MRLLLPALIALIPSLAYPQTNIIIEGKAQLIKDGKLITLSKVLPGKLYANVEQLATAHVIHHHFKFKIHSTGGQLFSLGCDKGNSWLFLNPGKIIVNVQDSILRKIVVSNNKTELDYKRFNLLTSNLDIDYGHALVDYRMYQSKPGADTSIIKIKMQFLDSVTAVRDHNLLNLIKDWLKHFPHSYINSYLIYYLAGKMPEQELKELFYASLSVSKNDVWRHALKYKIDSLFTGGVAPNISLPDSNQKQISLTSFKGKYVLIDFWASWCIPCRKESPFLLKAMQRFQNRNLTILSISFDEDRIA